MESEETKALILAAGETGKGPEGEDYGFPKNYKPKCLLKYEDEVILERNVKLLRKHGIKDIIVVIGYKAIEVMNFAVVEKDLRLKFVYNPDHSIEKSVNSLLLGLEEIEDEESFLVMVGDVILSEQVLRNIVECLAELCIRRTGAEMYMAKLTKKALGDLGDMKKEILSYSGEFAVYPLVCGLCKYLQRHESKEVEGEITEVDNFADVERWERG